jgi:hypothetical protein
MRIQIPEPIGRFPHRVPRPGRVVGTGCDYRKARSPRNGRLDLDAVTEQLEGPSNDEKPYSEPVAARGVESLKCVEDSRQLLRCDADTGVVDVDPHIRTGTAASD